MQPGTCTWWLLIGLHRRCGLHVLALVAVARRRTEAGYFSNILGNCCIQLWLTRDSQAQNAARRGYTAAATWWSRRRNEQVTNKEL